jgi:hypothetical protein
LKQNSGIILTMDILSVYGATAERLSCSRIDMNVGPADGRQHAASVARRLLQRGIAMDGTDAEQSKRWVVGCK